ncbi:ubiquinol-cytochrome C chaperone family protein [Breoghania sp.]|uniref:ubiquinol-cytochrome C chaperone family protein n=1 Tax=Breoghania sp. TaxID=2065378 RepID=UPI00261D6EC8|nr:ubiquinol-cytochrome C chaperone family protein [Breoghania sp.]MDJ0932295.1 ubiquinol-cytochrome C chaperone family protein [Breoghania sp.]
MAQARQPHFYEHLAVPDTIDGRFDMIALHAILLFARLKAEGEAAKARAQAVFDILFREMGASYTSVPHKIKRMAELFYGEASAYMNALEADDDRALVNARA